jgi:hypothetical protein
LPLIKSLYSRHYFTKETAALPHKNFKKQKKDDDNILDTSFNDDISKLEKLKNKKV